MTAAARHRVHEFVWRLHQLPDLAERLRHDRAAVLNAEDFTVRERDALADGSPPALTAIGMHPLVQIIYWVAINPEFSRLADASDWVTALKQE